MLDSFVRGIKMIGSSIKMGWQEKRLLLPSIVTVFTNIFFGLLLVCLAGEKMSASMQQSSHVRQMHRQFNQLNHPSAFTYGSNQAYGTFAQANSNPNQIGTILDQIGINGSMDPGGVNSFNGLLNSDSWLAAASIISIWWLTNRFLEGVTTALVYSHLTEGKGVETFREAAFTVLSSFPAIIVLGIITFLAKTIARGLRSQGGKPRALSFGFNFLASVVEIFWTLAGHLILPAIVIEGTSFWGGLKRADKIAQSSLLTIGIGEVGVDGICRFTSLLVYLAGLAMFGYMYYLKLALTNPAVILGALAWAGAVVAITALSIYLRAAFYTCLYVWAVNAEAVRESERRSIQAPWPLAAALA